MIYEILLDGKTLYYSGDPRCSVINAKLEQTLNDAGTFECEVPVTNPLYKAIENRRSMVQILKDGEEIFYGECRENEEVLDMTKSIYAVGELAFLFDSIQPQAKYQDQTPLQFFTALLNNHNAQVEEKKRFQVGVVTVTDPNDSIYRFTNREDTLTCLREKLCESLGGYLRIRKVNGVRYLDLVKLQDYGTTCEQPIEFGDNLLDYACNTSGVELVTAIIPLGARLEESPVEGLDAYTDITSVNGGKDYVYLPEAVNRFGWVKKVVHWDDVTEPANLKKKGETYLRENQYEILSLEVNAVDLSMLDRSIDSFDLGDSVHALAAPYGMDAWFPVQKKTTYLQDPSKNYIILSNTLKKSYSQQVSSITNQLEEKIPQQSTILQMAKNNASELIKAATNGYIVLNMNEDGNPKELLIMDTKDIDTAKKVWRWNINGLGYSHTGYNGEYGLAMTMDGRIVADFITAGTMYADRIRGGTLTLGGYDNDNGVIEVRDTDKNVRARINASGINVNDKFTVTLDGKMKCTDGEFEGTIKSTNAEILGGYVHISSQESAGNLIELKRPGTLVQMGTDGFRSTEGTIENPKHQCVVQYSQIRLSKDKTSMIHLDADTGTGGFRGGVLDGSDKRMKKDIVDLDKEQCAEFIYSLEPKAFRYNFEKNGHHHGFIAQSVREKAENGWDVCKKMFPADNGELYYGLAYTELIADLVATVQLQNKRIEELETKGVK